MVSKSLCETIPATLWNIQHTSVNGGSPFSSVSAVSVHIRSASRKHAFIILTPLNPTYIVKLGFTVVYIIFLIFAQKHRLWVLVRTASLQFALFASVVSYAQSEK